MVCNGCMGFVRRNFVLRPMRWRSPLLVHVAWACALGPTVGCGGPAHRYDATVSGAVTIDGELASSGMVSFYPVGEGRAAIGRIHPDGSYSLRTGQGDLRKVDGGTVMPGDYWVTVSINAPPAEGAVVGEGGPPISGPSLIAAKYSSKQTTDLRYTVEPGRQVINLDLERAAPRPAGDPGTEPEVTNDTADVVDAAVDEPRENDIGTGQENDIR